MLLEGNKRPCSVPISFAAVKTNVFFIAPAQKIPYPRTGRNMRNQLRTFEGDASMLSTSMKLRGVRVLKLYKTGYLKMIALRQTWKRFENKLKKSKKSTEKYGGENF